jgi:hypothetical protein
MPIDTPMGKHEIVLSSTGRLYYVKNANATFWLSVDPTEQEVKPFTFWKVAEGATETRSDDHPMVVRYFAAQQRRSGRHG